MTKMTWTEIRNILSGEIDAGTLAPGDRLPTEPELVARFGVGRHSIRRAVEALAKEGRLSVQQGRGTFIEAAPKLTYSIGRRTRLRRNLLPQGYDVSSTLLDGKQIPAPDHIRTVLKLAPGSEIIASRRLTKANALPIAFGSIFHSAERFTGLLERREVLGSLTEVYRSYGITDYLRGETTIYARPARAEEAKMLQQHPDMPVHVIKALDIDAEGTPLAYSKVIWSSARVKFTMAHDDD